SVARRNRARSVSVSAATSLPSMRTLPRSGVSRPPMRRSSVDFPEPLRPITTTSSPRPIDTEASVSTTCGPQPLVPPRSSIALGEDLVMRRLAVRLGCVWEDIPRSRVESLTSKSPQLGLIDRVSNYWGPCTMSYDAIRQRLARYMQDESALSTNEKIL